MREALLYTQGKDKCVDCHLCRHHCHIKEGTKGICMVRENRGGKLYSIFWGHPCALAVDPIEKKPLFHFKPGTRSLSVATPGCNFQCGFCQNWNISQFGHEPNATAPFVDLSNRPETLPEALLDEAIARSCASISYTYSEPTVFYEYAKDVAIKAKVQDIDNVFVTNGYMSREMLDDFGGLLNAANIDLKAFREETYKHVMKAKLSGVLDSIEYMKKLGIWIEITTLVVPNMNDSCEELKDIANFIASVGKEIPWHISRFYPQYKFSKTPPTPIETIKMAVDLGKEAGLKFVYSGNVVGEAAENTNCPKCGKLLIERSGYTIKHNFIKDSSCPSCQEIIEGKF